MIAPAKRSRAHLDAQINIVPYIDVMLVLLVIFMMTTPIIQQGVEVDLPTSGTHNVDFSVQEPTIISINKDGEYFINSLDNTPGKADETRLSLRILVSRVRARLDVYPQMKVFVRGDREVAYGSVVALMSFLQNNGVGKVGLVTESPQ